MERGLCMWPFKWLLLFREMPISLFLNPFGLSVWECTTFSCTLTIGIKILWAIKKIYIHKLKKHHHYISNQIIWYGPFCSARRAFLCTLIYCIAFFKFYFYFCLQNLQASRCVGKNSRVLVCHCRRADDRTPGACHCFQLQLLLSQGDRPGRDAVTKFQPCPELSIYAWSLRWDAMSAHM